MASAPGLFVLLPNLVIVPFVTSYLEMLQRLFESTQYTSGDYQKALHDHRMIPSMSGRGQCWDAQFTMFPNAAFGLTRAGIGDMPLR